MIELLRPWVLVLAPLPLLAWWLLPPLAPRSVVPVPNGVRDLFLGLARERTRRRARWPAGSALRILGWLALVVALAGPHTRDAVLHKPTGRDLLVALDLSSSMDENDMLLNGRPAGRYEVVNALIGQFISGREGDRVGLIAFGHEAFLITPLSFDVGAVAAILGELNIGLPGHRTDLGQAVGLAVQTLTAVPEEATRVVVLLSDGEDNSGALVGVDAARLAAEHDIKIHAIGFSANIDSDGAAVLREMAELTGGEYFAAQTPEALQTISARIDELEASAARPEQDNVLRDWSGVAVLISLAALAGLAFQELRTP